MRNLNLDEKISIKGELSRKGVVPSSALVALKMNEATSLYWKCFGKPISTHSTPKQYRKKTQRRAHQN